MKKQITALLLALLLITTVGCGKEPYQNDSQREVPSTSNTSKDNTDAPSTSTSSDETYQPENVTEMLIQVSDGKNIITFRLNDSKAAKNLYDQLPLSLEVENYSNNEKIFYPPQSLDVSDAPKAGGEVGTLAYYAPWADVVMFFGSYSPNSNLYELGQAVSGSEQIQSLEGTITIELLP